MREIKEEEKEEEAKSDHTQQQEFINNALEFEQQKRDKLTIKIEQYRKQPDVDADTLLALQRAMIDSLRFTFDALKIRTEEQERNNKKSQENPKNLPTSQRFIENMSPPIEQQEYEPILEEKETFTL